MRGARTALASDGLSRMPRVLRAGSSILALALLAALVLAGLVPCKFQRIFGLPCPGCGTTRAMRALLSGDVGRALHLNPVGPFVALLIGGLVLQALVSMVRDGDVRGMGRGRLGAFLQRALIVAAALEVIVWIARFFGALGGPVPIR